MFVPKMNELFSLIILLLSFIEFIVVVKNYKFILKNNNIVALSHNELHLQIEQ